MRRPKHTRTAEQGREAQADQDRRQAERGTFKASEQAHAAVQLQREAIDNEAELQRVREAEEANRVALAKRLNAEPSPGFTSYEETP